jgi:hypothetical protein
MAKSETETVLCCEAHYREVTVTFHERRQSASGVYRTATFEDCYVYMINERYWSAKIRSTIYGYGSGIEMCATAMS